MASVALNHVDKVFSFASYVGINGACFAECVVGKSMGNVRTGSAVFATAKRTGRKCGIRMSYVRGQFSSRSRRVRGAPEATTGRCRKATFRRKK